MSEKSEAQASRALVRARASVKKKLGALKRQKFLSSEEAKESLAPLIQPLQTMSEISSLEQMKMEPKEEPLEVDEDIGASPFGVPPTLPTIFPPPSGEVRIPTFADTGAGPPPSLDPENLRIISNVTDKTFGPYVDAKTQNLMLGSKTYKTDPSSIIVGSMVLNRTPGLIELIERANPDENVITDYDKEMYQKILKSTNAHRLNFDPKKRAKGNTSSKYKKYIRVKRTGATSGTGSKIVGGDLKQMGCQTPASSTMEVDWHDPNELCDRLRILVASRDAGHTGHEEEINRIISELRNAGYIV